jgi:hypothetical protein
VLNSNYQWSAGSNVTSNRTKTCTISKYNLSSAIVSADNQTYNGSAKTPAPTVKM